MLAEVPSPRGFGVRGNGGIHCPRAFRRVVSNPPYLVGYCRWDGRSGRMTPPDNHTHDFTSHPFVKIVERHEAAPLPGRLAEGGLGVDVLAPRVEGREAELGVLGPRGDQAPAHDVEAALAVENIVTHDRQRIGRRHVPARRKVRRRPLRRNPERELDLADIAREAGAATHWG